MRAAPEHLPNPCRVAAGRANRAKRGPLSADGRQRLRQAASRTRPWLFSTGPRTAEGKSRSALNGKRRQQGPISVREMKAELSAARSLIAVVKKTCQRLPRSPS